VELSSTQNREAVSSRRVRAIIEIVNGELEIYPLADSDTDERQILDALRFVRKDFQG
jgi:hypothetical protein